MAAMDVPGYLTGEKPDERAFGSAAASTPGGRRAGAGEHKVWFQVFGGCFADPFNAHQIFDAGKGRLIRVLRSQSLANLNDCLGALFSNGWDGRQLLPTRDVGIELAGKFRGAQSICRLRGRNVGAIPGVANRQHQREYRQQHKQRASLRAQSRESPDRASAPLPLLKRFELLAHLLEPLKGRLGAHHVVQQPAAGKRWTNVGEISPGDAFDVRLAQRQHVDGFHPVGLKLRVPGPMPATAC